MTQEEKELLLKDLCARLPYGVIALTEEGKGHICDINLTIFGTEIGVNTNPCIRGTFVIEDIKPYLFPLENMTEEQKTFFDDKHIDIDDILGIVAIFAHVNCEEWIEIIDWLNKNHFDYRGLIEKGLAIDATDLDIY